ncbi:Type II secretory pathway, component ExeA (predicted ATPase) [Geoalkalibacter ferrihydriticus]|uniref:ATPase n=2 Tax=Geoalkalibacter ferrihydriticus TaxID=392333 RepID=A0A0C2HX63_9BACT|nr:AAA family ATPase [Geoalkalibacter ferrihydriticus]KIH77367.1 ATPase [Geoalkalibacter ferrihydriticus DSM 17813]SDM18006.1 Type II secretory pathway, component ExeA (predicted ATPase) [Geoalkalibacter ferrihydriticus]
MYESFYGFRERPFSKTPDPRFLYLSRSHREALARLLFAVEERDLALLTGGIGCGKTTISRALMDQLDSSFKVILLINPRLTPLEFLRALARHLGVEEPSTFKTDLLEQIGEKLYLLYQQGVCPVLVIDEAQLVPHKETFDEIRLLTNFQLDDRNLLSVILMGQPELRRRLSHPVYEPLRQRIGMQYELQCLNRDETEHYLDFRLQTAGGQAGLFSPAAVDRIHELSQGVPRRINHAASLALIEGFGREARQLDGSILDAVADELRLFQ